MHRISNRCTAPWFLHGDGVLPATKNFHAGSYIHTQAHTKGATPTGEVCGIRESLIKLNAVTVLVTAYFFLAPQSPLTDRFPFRKTAQIP